MRTNSSTSPQAGRTNAHSTTVPATEQQPRSRGRVLIPIFQIVVPVACVMSALGIDRRLGLNWYPAQRLAVVLGVALAYIFLRAITDKGWRNLYPVALVASLTSTGYLFLNFEEVFRNAGTPSPASVALGSVLVVAVLVGLYQVYGKALAAIFLLFSIYPLLAPSMPGLLQGRQQNYSRIITGYFTQRDGIFGAPLDVSVSVVSVFIVMGAILTVLGVGDKLANLAMWAFGRSRGGPAKVSVVTSGLLGSISGSAAGNVATTGVLTIPLMQKIGFSRTMSGAVEATASTGGLIMPPIMGAAAFIMAEFLGIPYGEIALAAIVPGVLYYVALFMLVHFEAVKVGIARVPRIELPAFKEGSSALYLGGVPLLALVYFLMIERREPAVAGFAAIVVLLIVGAISNTTRPRLKKIGSALRDSADPLANIILIVAAAGLAVGAVTMTGLGAALVQAVFQLADNSLFLALLLTALASITLGMSMPAVGVYVILAMIVTPGLVDLGISPLAAHMFVYYFGILSFITPPVCIAAYMAASISGAKPMPTALQSMRLAFVAYLIPFIFVYNPELLLAEGTLVKQAVTVLVGSVAILIAAAALGGGRMKWVTRLALAAISVLLVYAVTLWTGPPI
jgi:TRAP transporter 4TM/12TM fusion protein